MIGLDIGNKFLKICKIIKKDSKDLSVIAIMQSIANVDDNGKTQIITELLSKLRVQNEAMFLAVGGKEIINRDFVLPESKMNSGNLKETLTSEFTASLTENISSMYTSFCLTRITKNNEHCIMFSAIPKDIVNSKFRLVANLSNTFVKGVTMESLALANSFIEFGPSYKNTESVLLINIGYSNTNMVVINNKELVFSKDMDFGGVNITKEIANIYMVPEQLAEEIKRSDELKQKIDFNMKNVLKKTTSSLIESIFRTIEYCITRQFIVYVDRIVITGGGAITDDIDSFIEETLGIPTAKWNPLDDLNIVGYSDKKCGYFMPIALGLALEQE